MESEIILFSRSFLPNLCSSRGCEWEIVAEMLGSSSKSKSRSHLLEEIFWPPDSQLFFK